MKTRRPALNVLGYYDGNEYVALALEMDLRGFGASLQAAMNDLQRQVMLQLGFALHMHNSPDMAYFPAAPVWFERFAEARNVALRSLSADMTADDSVGFHALGLSVPEPHIIMEEGRRFVRRNG